MQQKTFESAAKGVKISDTKAVSMYYKLNKSLWLYVNKLMCEIQTFYIFPQNDLKRALELIGAPDHDKTFCLNVFFFRREEINIPT